MSSTYRTTRKSLAIRQDFTSRKAVSTEMPAPGIAATIDPAIVLAFELAVAEVVAVAQRIAAKYGMTDQIAVRHDWTHRTFEAEAPLSRGGKYSNRFRALDGEVDADGEPFDRAAGISLRLGHYARHQPTVWREYRMLHMHPAVGSRFNISTLDVVRFVTAHECAHAIQFSISPKLGRKIATAYRNAGSCIVGQRGRGNDLHGPAWQALYAEIRESAGLQSIGELPGEIEHEADIAGLENRVDLTPERIAAMKAAFIALAASKIGCCRVCGMQLVPSGKEHPKGGGRHARYCSTSCKMKAARARAKAKG